jgi:hypothetical protein
MSNHSISADIPCFNSCPTSEEQNIFEAIEMTPGYLQVDMRLAPKDFGKKRGGSLQENSLKMLFGGRSSCEMVASRLAERSMRSQHSNHSARAFEGDARNYVVYIY